MNTNKKIIIVSVVLIIIAFFGGYKVGGSAATSAATAARAARTGGMGGNFAGRGGTGAGGGFVTGDIIAKDATSITVNMRTGGSKIILISPSTSVSKMAAGSLTDLSVGTAITANGTTNSDGSITATMVSIRPASTTRAQ